MKRKKLIAITLFAYTINIAVQHMDARKFKKTIDTIAGKCIAVRIRMLNRMVTNIYDDALRPLGIKVSQMNILVAAAKMGTVRPAQLSEQLHLNVSTLSRNVERMKARGWLEVVPEEDGRTHPFRLTNEGRVMVEQAAPTWKKAQRRARALLGDRTVELVGLALRRVETDSTSP